jgi:hypothetical protein
MFDLTLEFVSDAMKEPALSAEEQMERRVDSIIRDLDELIAFAANSETVDLVEAQRVGVGQIVSRAQLIASFLMARNPSKLRVISNG